MAARGGLFTAAGNGEGGFGSWTADRGRDLVPTGGCKGDLDGEGEDGDRGGVLSAAGNSRGSSGRDAEGWGGELVGVCVAVFRRVPCDRDTFDRKELVFGPGPLAMLGLKRGSYGVNWGFSARMGVLDGVPSIAAGVGFSALAALETTFLGSVRGVAG